MLAEAGFTVADARNAWRWHDNAICVFNIRAVGNYFSQVTGWPPGSFCAWLAVLYKFMPVLGEVALDGEGRMVPREAQGHMRSHLECVLEQGAKVHRLPNPRERERRDIFWMDHDGDNASEVAEAVAAALRDQGLPWFSRMLNLEQALAEVEASRDCYDKFDKTAFLARELGDHDRWERDARRAEAEAQRIQRPIHRLERYGI